MKDKANKPILISCVAGVGYSILLIFGIIFLLFATCIGLIALPDPLRKSILNFLGWLIDSIPSFR